MRGQGAIEHQGVRNGCADRLTGTVDDGSGEGIAACAAQGRGEGPGGLQHGGVAEDGAVGRDPHDLSGFQRIGNRAGEGGCRVVGLTTIGDEALNGADVVAGAADQNGEALHPQVDSFGGRDIARCIGGGDGEAVAGLGLDARAGLDGHNTGVGIDLEGGRVIPAQAVGHTTTDVSGIGGGGGVDDAAGGDVGVHRGPGRRCDGGGDLIEVVDHQRNDLLGSVTDSVGGDDGEEVVALGFEVGVRGEGDGPGGGVDGEGGGVADA